MVGKATAALPCSPLLFFSFPLPTRGHEAVAHLSLAPGGDGSNPGEGGEERKPISPGSARTVHDKQHHHIRQQAKV